MIERALFQIVTLRVTSASLSFKKIQVQERDTLAHGHILCTIVAILFEDSIL